MKINLLLLCLPLIVGLIDSWEEYEESKYSLAQEEVYVPEPVMILIYESQTIFCYDVIVDYGRL